MANEMFTRKDGTQIPVPVLTVPPDVVTTIMRMVEDQRAKGKRTNNMYVLLDLISTGKSTLERRVKTAAKNKDNKNTGKAIKEYIRVQLLLRKPIDPFVIAELSGVQVPQSEEVEEPEEFSDNTELTDEQLESATAPHGVA